VRAGRPDNQASRSARQRTVQTHLAHVFGNLQVSSCAQLAAEATRRRTGQHGIGQLADVSPAATDGLQVAMIALLWRKGS
jgi:hypothetical protein